MNCDFRSCGGSKKEVNLPNIVKKYIKVKVGVDVGDQRLRDRRAYADHIKLYGWNRKWGMHAIQQIRHQAFLCWAGIHNFQTGNKQECKRWYPGRSIPGNGSVNWAFNVGLIKQIIAHIITFKQATDKRQSHTKMSTEDTLPQHTIVKRVENGKSFRNMRCAVCLHKNRNRKKSNKGTVRRSGMWCPHPHCQVHVCPDHQEEVHNYYNNGVILKQYHNEKRVQHTSEHSGNKKPKKRRKTGT